MRAKHRPEQGGGCGKRPSGGLVSVFFTVINTNKQTKNTTKKLKEKVKRGRERGERPSFDTTGPQPASALGLRPRRAPPAPSSPAPRSLGQAGPPCSRTLGCLPRGKDSDLGADPRFRVDINSRDRVILLPEKTSPGSWYVPNACPDAFPDAPGLRVGVVCVRVNTCTLYAKDENRRGF